MFQTRIIKKQLHFKQPAGTSRGVYTTRNVWYILLTDTGSRHYGVGECAPLPALSCDDIPSYDEVLATACKNLEKNGEIDREALLPYPSILFGMETALLHFRARSLQFWHTPFSKGKEGIPINGLIWMGNFDEMYRRIGEKMQQGFRCIKLKIGAIDFEKELELLAHIRRHFTPAQIAGFVAVRPTGALGTGERGGEETDFVVGERFHQFDGLGEFVLGGRGTVKGFVDGCWAGDVELYFGQRVQADEAFEQGGIPPVRLYADREAALGELLHQFDEVIFLRRRALGKVEAGNPAVQQVAARDRSFEGVPGQQVGDDFPGALLDDRAVGLWMWHSMSSGILS